MNSFGAMCWTKLLETIPQDVLYDFAACGAIVVNYCSLLVAFKGRAKIVSVSVDYECGSCNHREARVHAAGELKAMDELASSPCPRCKTGRVASELELDDYLAVMS